jgi:HD-GYP domain-containing protein (c-di-GMP phosphodiesterase class II)
LRRQQEIGKTQSLGDSRPVAILAHPDPDEAKMLRSVLETRTFHVVEVRDGPELAIISKRHSASVMVVSLDLPRINPKQLIQDFHDVAGRNDTLLLLVVPKGATPDKLVGYETYASDYIQSPISVAEFEARLSAILRARGLNRQLEPVASSGSGSAGHGEKRMRGVQMLGIASRGARDDEPDAKPKVAPSAETRTESDVAPLRGNAPEGSASATAPFPASQGRNTVLPDAILEHQFLGATTLDYGFLSEEDVSADEIELYKTACAFLLASIAEAEKGIPIEAELGLEIADLITKSSKANNGLLLLSMRRTAEFSLVQHSTNVAVISIPVAEELGFEDNRIVRLCLAGMLHDIGSVKLPKKFLFRTNSFSASERAEIEHRPLYAEQLLSGLAGFEWLPRIVAQVYERDNGKGYPHRLKGKEILDDAKVLGLADLFEAYIHNRPHRKAMTGYQTFIQILNDESKSFPERIIKAMLRGLTIYPLNDYVVLNTGAIGKVVGTRRDNPLRPQVKVLYSANGETVEQSKIIDLAQDSILWITKAITADELPR